MSTVSVARSGFSSPEIRKAIFDLLGRVELEKRNVQSILIKTNACFYWDSSTGQTTDLRVISAVIDWLRERYGQDVTIRIGEADASAMRVRHVFEVLNYVELAKQKRSELVNLSEGEKFEKEVTVGKKKIVFPFSKMISNSNMLVNVPKMKSHPITAMTCCLKNVYGMIYEPYKWQYHTYIDQAIVAANKIIRPDLNVVDGVVANGKRPVKLGLLLAGTDPVAVDSVSAKIMGYEPSEISHVVLAEKEGVGKSKEIAVVGEDPEQFRSVFPRRNVAMEKRYIPILLGLLSLYSRVAGDIIPPAMEKLGSL
jgi:uncharacterized protein (DUF362 family)